MNLIAYGMLILCCIPTLGFAWRGIALLCTTQTKPGRMISVSGVVAMISIWAFAGVVHFVAFEYRKIYDEFDLDLSRLTELIISLSEWSHMYWYLWFPVAVALSLAALLVPEMLINRSQRSVVHPS